ncbi:phosphonate C-P lyase system protein PhnG [Hyphomicrobiaceae bacterium 22]|uniref:Phosphonate C-P lyase system protein PhnG n=2 Tax=Prosthecodimorpha staleyi TaxID=2840188 RepID=A0A947GCI0_9HYPH|nr:phosphonate C-P lyase system protein PhnG [Prosthecodimorpha staleyi]
MAAFAAATPAELAVALDADAIAQARDLRPAAAGLVMVRGRIGGDGPAFNLGEATVARASVRLDGGRTGHAYRLGRDTDAARLAAIADALWQDPARRPAIEAALVTAVEARLAAADEAASRRAAATRVDFFTMVRGED